MKPIQVTQWEANDGTLFDTVEECLEYENLQALENMLEDDPIGYIDAPALSKWLKKHSGVVCKFLHAEE